MDVLALICKNCSSTPKRIRRGPSLPRIRRWDNCGKKECEAGKNRLLSSAPGESDPFQEKHPIIHLQHTYTLFCKPGNEQYVPIQKMCCSLHTSLYFTHYNGFHPLALQQSLPTVQKVTDTNLVTCEQQENSTSQIHSSQDLSLWVCF